MVTADTGLLLKTILSIAVVTTEANELNGSRARFVGTGDREGTRKRFDVSVSVCGLKIACSRASVAPDAKAAATLAGMVGVTVVKMLLRVRVRSNDKAVRDWAPAGAEKTSNPKSNATESIPPKFRSNFMCSPFFSPAC